MTDALITGCCMQEYCVSCVDDLKPAEREGEDVNLDEKSCPTCRGRLTGQSARLGALLSEEAHAHVVSSSSAQPTRCSSRWRELHSLVCPSRSLN